MEEDKIKINIWQVSTVVFAVLFVLAIFNVFSFGGSITKITGNAVGYLNENVLASQGVEATLINSEKSNGLYKATVNIDGQVGEFYISQDGKLLFTGAIPLSEDASASPVDSTNTQPSNGVLEVSAANGISLGPEDAEITVTEFSDFQCPYCAMASGLPSWVDKYQSQYGDLIGSAQKLQDLASQGKIKFVYVPMSFLGSESTYSAQAALCADKQGKFWEMHDAIFTAQTEGENTGKYNKPELKIIALGILGMDSVKFNNCLDTDETLSEAQAINQASNGAGVSGTPAFFVNGKSVQSSWTALSGVIGV